MKKFISEIKIEDAVRVIITSIILTFVLTNPSAAQDFSGVESFLTTVVDAITGPIGKAIAAIAVMAVGFSFMTGRMDWTFAVAIIMGIAIVFGAATFVSSVSPA